MTETRKLAAIMFTDIVGYSAMSQRNEELAMELLEHHRSILREVFKPFRGQEIKTIGDAFLVEFSSALDAVNCGIEIQDALHNYNLNSSEERQVVLRIGIHVGDVIHRDGDIYGDGVNISSRIEPLANPGGICISEDVARLVQNKLKIPLEKMERRELKNIDLPVDTYQVNVAGATIKKEVREVSQEENNRLAVIPFQNFSPDRETDYFSDGLTEEMIMHLSRIKELKVVSRTTSMQYKNTQKDMHAIGKELNARYILEGSVRKHLDNLRITAQLIDVKTDTHLWANTFKGNMADIFDIQESVAKEIVSALRLTLSPAEQVALGKRATDNMEAYDLNLHARGFLYRKLKGYTLAAIDLFQKAVELDPRYAAAYAGLGEAYAFLFEAFDKNPTLLDKAMDAALKALMYDASSSEAYSALGVVYYVRESYEEATTAVGKAIELDPNDFFAYWIQGRIFRILDRDKEAIESFEKVLELNPDFHTAYGDIHLSLKRLGKEEELKELKERALTFYPSYLMRNPDDSRAIMFYAFILLDDNQAEEAKSKMARAIQLSPTDATMIYNAACFYSDLGEKEDALKHLKLAISNGFEAYEYIKIDPDLDGIRNEPEYIELMKDK
ncbi:MAG: tetratricopeptide repeat protein [Flavobacteriales bacterium]|nr:tetratricopeptide repeat protein [Flavobacteriales bacterium]